jgi:glycosyltransferase involved in cell wall biosynthesis
LALLTIIIPVFNEEATINQVINCLENSRLPDGFEREIIIINDGSSDKTFELIGCYSDRHIVINQANSGKGAAVRKGFYLSKGDFIVVQDADLEQNPDDFSNLIQPILAGASDVVFGSRFAGAYRPESTKMYLHYLVNKFFTSMVIVFTGYKITDVWTGYKMYSRKAINIILPSLTSDGIEFELEVAILLAKNGLRVSDVPIAYHPRWYEEGKKTNWRQAVTSMRKLLAFYFRKL